MIYDLVFVFRLFRLLDFDAGDDTMIRRNRSWRLVISCPRQGCVLVDRQATMGKICCVKGFGSLGL